MTTMTKARIYKITSTQTDKVYIGSTKQTLERRLIGHKSEYKCDTNRTKSVELLCYDDCQIELIEEVEYDDIKDLRTKEGQYIKEMKEQAVNKRIEGRTKKEYMDQWYIDNEDYDKDYYKANKEVKNTKSKEYYEANKDSILAKEKAHREANIVEARLRDKANRDANKDKINLRRKELYQANKEKINARCRALRDAKKDVLNARRRELYALKKSHSSPSPVSVSS